jgi:DmsE family decaheme c-type cytochrome
MHGHRTRLVSIAALTVAWVVTTVTVARMAGGSDAMSAVSFSQTVTQPAAPGPAPQPAAGYVGDDTCTTCHTGQTVKGSAHARVANPRTPAAQQGCESCHGPGQAHVDDEAKGHIRKFSRIPAREASEACLTCHTRGAHALWQGSPHDTRNLSCTTCHSVHAPTSPAAQLKAVSQQELCVTCHQPQVLKTKRQSHMPVREGKLECSSCHNPHGTTNIKLLKVGNWINESCVSCHAEKRGPFLYEHAAGRESCVSCHDPHGSSNERMLVAKPPMLCQRCHIGSRHPSTIYDATQLASRSNRLIGRACVNCHSAIHGTNHPAGGTFLR